MSILDELSVGTSELVINEDMCNMYSIKNTLNKWGKKLVKDNIGSIVSKSALNLILNLISQIVALNINYLGKLFGLISFN